MRDPHRIMEFMEELVDLWETYVPDWRFGQLMFNFISWYGDPFFLEEDDFLEKLQHFLEDQGYKEVSE